MSLSAMKNLIQSAIRPLRNRVYSMIKRAVIESVNDAGGIQLVKLNLLAGEARDGIERFQNFGFSSNPPSSAECVAAAIGGNNDHLIVMVADDRSSRPKNLQSGETIVYTNDGTFIKLKKGGKIEILTATEVKISSGNTIITGDLKVQGKVEVTGDIDSQGKIDATGDITGGKVLTILGTDLDVVKTVFNTHTHAAGVVPPPDQQIP